MRRFSCLTGAGVALFLLTFRVCPRLFETGGIGLIQTSFEFFSHSRTQAPTPVAANGELCLHA